MQEKSKPLKLAFLGGSVDSAVGTTHFIACKMDNNFIVSAGCFSRNDTINKKTAQIWGVEKAHTYADWNTLLECEIGNVDAIVILTPTPNHFEMIMKALELGYSVISEKALASNYEQSKVIVNKIIEKNAFFAVTHNYTGYPMLRELQAMIRDNKLGKITNINIEMPQESFARTFNGNKAIPQSWRLTDGEIPGVSLDLGTHLQHLIYFLVEENPIELVADQARLGLFEDIVDHVTCMVRYPSGMRCQMWYGKAAIGHRNGFRIRVYGTEASAEWYQMNPEELVFQTIEGSRLIIDRASPQINVANLPRYTRFKAGHSAGFIEAFANLYEDIAEKLREYKQNPTWEIDWSYTAKQASLGLQVFEAVDDSSKNNKWIKLDI